MDGAGIDRGRPPAGVEGAVHGEALAHDRPGLLVSDHILEANAHALEGGGPASYIKSNVVEGLKTASGDKAATK